MEVEKEPSGKVPMFDKELLAKIEELVTSKVHHKISALAYFGTKIQTGPFSFAINEKDKHRKKLEQKTGKVITRDIFDHYVKTAQKLIDKEQQDKEQQDKGNNYKVAKGGYFYDWMGYSYNDDTGHNDKNSSSYVEANKSRNGTSESDIPTQISPSVVPTNDAQHITPKIANTSDNISLNNTNATDNLLQNTSPSGSKVSNSHVLTFLIALVACCVAGWLARQYFFNSKRTKKTKIPMSEKSYSQDSCIDRAKDLKKIQSVFNALSVRAKDNGMLILNDFPDLNTDVLKKIKLLKLSMDMMESDAFQNLIRKIPLTHEKSQAAGDGLLFIHESLALLTATVECYRTCMKKHIADMSRFTEEVTEIMTAMDPSMEKETENSRSLAELSKRYLNLGDTNQRIYNLNLTLDRIFQDFFKHESSKVKPYLIDSNIDSDSLETPLLEDVEAQNVTLMSQKENHTLYRVYKKTQDCLHTIGFREIFKITDANVLFKEWDNMHKYFTPEIRTAIDLIQFHIAATSVLFGNKKPHYHPPMSMFNPNGEPREGFHAITIYQAMLNARITPLSGFTSYPRLSMFLMLCEVYEQVKSESYQGIDKQVYERAILTIIKKAGLENSLSEQSPEVAQVIEQIRSQAFTKEILGKVRYGVLSLLVDGIEDCYTKDNTSLLDDLAIFREQQLSKLSNLYTKYYLEPCQQLNAQGCLASDTFTINKPVITCELTNTIDILWREQNARKTYLTQLKGKIPDTPEYKMKINLSSRGNRSIATSSDGYLSDGGSSHDDASHLSGSSWESSPDKNGGNSSNPYFGVFNDGRSESATSHP